MTATSPTAPSAVEAGKCWCVATTTAVGQSCTVLHRCSGYGLLDKGLLICNIHIHLIFVCVYVCVKVFLRGVCGSPGRRRLGGGGHQRRPVELLHVRTSKHLRVTAATGRLALQAAALLRQQPWAGICEFFFLLVRWHGSSLGWSLNSPPWFHLVAGAPQIICSCGSWEETANQSPLLVWWHRHRQAHPFYLLYIFRSECIYKCNFFFHLWWLPPQDCWCWRTWVSRWTSTWPPRCAKTPSLWAWFDTRDASCTWAMSVTSLTNM